LTLTEFMYYLCSVLTTSNVVTSNMNLKTQANVFFSFKLVREIGQGNMRKSILTKLMYALVYTVPTCIGAAHAEAGVLGRGGEGAWAEGGRGREGVGGGREWEEGGSGRREEGAGIRKCI
jgi:hypothetical protein